MSVGFIRRLAKTGAQSIPVVAGANVVISCVAVLLMCTSIIATALCCHLRLPGRFGLLLIGLYSIYVLTCIAALVI